MRILDKTLCFNICKIEVPVFNKDLRDPDLSERVRANIPEVLQYSSRFWFTHIPESGSTEGSALLDESYTAVSKLLCTKQLLFWFEALSLQGAITQSLSAFQKCITVFGSGVCISVFYPH